jgi:hypothetical protein
MTVQTEPVTLKIQLPTNRNYVGRLLALDSAGRVLAGPFPIAGRASDAIAAEHGNLTRATTLPFGDPPVGSYRFVGVADTGPGTRYRSDLFGDLAAVVLCGRDGHAALADANGRFEFLIHGGPLSQDGRLRATTGHFRISDPHLLQVTALIKQATTVSCTCEEVARISDADLVDEMGSASEGRDSLRTQAQLAFRPSLGFQDVVAHGEYSPPPDTPPSPSDPVWGGSCTCQVKMADGSIKTVSVSCAETYTQGNASIQLNQALSAAVGRSGGAEVSGSVSVNLTWKFP